MGYFISGMIQAFVPEEKMTRYLGTPGFKSVSFSTLFGAAFSYCSFAALASARSFIQKRSHRIKAVAFMFASTNLVIKLGILIIVFLPGWLVSLENAAIAPFFTGATFIGSTGKIPWPRSSLKTGCFLRVL